jgi:enterobactin synthetase component D / holo-[acyl-carrier protein] synthase
MAEHREPRQLTEAHIRRGLPYTVGVGLRHVDHASEDVPPLMPGEEQALGARAVPQRRRLYAEGRAAARDALAQLGVGLVAIGRGGGGQPLWPEGIVGAISHSRELAVAVVGWSSDYAGLGVDVEDLDRGVDARIARLVARPAEMAWLNLEAGLERMLMLFSAKEAVFKALYPVEQVWFGFGDAELTWHADRGVFDAELVKAVGAHYPSGFHLEVPCVAGPTWVASSAFVPR